MHFSVPNRVPVPVTTYFNKEFIIFTSLHLYLVIKSKLRSFIIIRTLPVSVVQSKAENNNESFSTLNVIKLIRRFEGKPLVGKIVAQIKEYKLQLPDEGSLLERWNSVDTVSGSERSYVLCCIFYV